jgi:hypothetical protein
MPSAWTVCCSAGIVFAKINDRFHAQGGEVLKTFGSGLGSTVDVVVHAIEVLDSGGGKGWDGGDQKDNG